MLRTRRAREEPDLVKRAGHTRPVLPLARRIHRLERRLRQLYAERNRDEARFLVTVSAVVTRNEFSALDLLAHTRHDPALRAVLAGMTARTLGARLRRLAGHDVAGQVLTKIGRDEAGCIWQFVSQAPAGV